MLPPWQGGYTNGLGKNRPITFGKLIPSQPPLPPGTCHPPFSGSRTHLVRDRKNLRRSPLGTLVNPCFLRFPRMALQA